MIDEVKIEPIGDRPDLYSGPPAAFVRIEVRPHQGDSYDPPIKPVMPLLARGQNLVDEHDEGTTWTVLRATVCRFVEPYGRRFYWYEYIAVNGPRTLS